MKMTSSLNYYALLISFILVQGFLLLAGTVLFASGLVDLFAFFAFAGIVLAWVFYRQGFRALATASEFDEHLANPDADTKQVLRNAGLIIVPRYTYVRRFRSRRRLRKALGIKPSRGPLVAPVTATLLWVSFFLFLASVNL